MKPEQDVFFVGVGNTIDIRRNILESLKDTIESLQLFEKLKGIREDKTKNLAKLRLKMREISALVNDVKDLLPKTGIKVKAKKAKKEVRKVVAQKPKLEKPKEISEFEKLDRELRVIESKLNTLA